MPQGMLQGKSFQAIARDVVDGYFILNPLTLKKFSEDDYKGLHHQLKKIQVAVRNEKFPLNDVVGIRQRNMRLQRVHQALIIIEHCAKDLRIRL